MALGSVFIDPPPPIVAYEGAMVSHRGAEEIRELERLWNDKAPDFQNRRRASKWGENIGPDVIAGIREGHGDAIEDGILFLEVNPRFFRSGYHKGRLARVLKTADLSAAQEQRL